MSCHVVSGSSDSLFVFPTSCRLVSCLIVSYLVLSCRILSYLVFSRVLSCPVSSCLILSYLVLSRRVVFISRRTSFIVYFHHVVVSCQMERQPGGADGQG